jgi:hypothetical protein
MNELQWWIQTFGPWGIALSAAGCVARWIKPLIESLVTEHRSFLKTLNEQQQLQTQQLIQLRLLLELLPCRSMKRDDDAHAGTC